MIDSRQIDLKGWLHRFRAKDDDKESSRELLEEFTLQVT